MAQIFPRSANSYSKVIIVAVLALFCLVGWTTYEVFWSPYTTYVGIPLPQPVLFSHKHHVGDDGIDCRYCHHSVEQSSFAGFPDTYICMTCHSQIWTDTPLLRPVRASLASRQPIRWTRVNDLPDFVFFNHSIHVNKGVGCSTCHGQLDEMPLTWRTQTLYMKWCLDCHRAPQSYLRPPDQIYNLHWTPPPDQETRGLTLARTYHVDLSGRLTDCSVCHR
jgi:DNA-directed RNA polymerase subunit RPC12/RpoP